MYAILIASIGNCVISFAKDISIAAGIDGPFAVTLVGVLPVCNGLSRIVFGRMFDSASKRSTMVTASCIAIFAMLCMYIAVSFELSTVVVIGIITAGIAYGSFPPVFSGFVSDTYGQKYFALNFSVANTMQFIASFSSTFGGAIISGSGGYPALFVVFLVFAAASLGIAATFGVKSKAAQKSVSPS